MRIAVKNEDLGFWTEVEIPVVRYEQDNIVYCNHAGAINDTLFHETYSYEREDVIQTHEPIMVCRKCGAFNRVHDSEWEEAPAEGRH